MTSQPTDLEPARSGRGRPRRPGARVAILNASLELLAEHGFQATTMDAIAERAGVGKNTIYRRWCSKNELIVDALGELTAELDLEVQEDADVRSLLLTHVRHLIHFFEDPLPGRLLPGLLGELQRNPAFAEAYSERVVRPRRGPIVDLVTHALERGELRPGIDPDLIADLLVGPPFFRLILSFGLPGVPADYAERLVDTIWRGLAASETSHAE